MKINLKNEQQYKKMQFHIFQNCMFPSLMVNFKLFSITSMVGAKVALLPILPPLFPLLAPDDELNHKK